MAETDRRTIEVPSLIAYEDRCFVVEQCRDCSLPGYLIVRANTGAEGWNDVSGDALAELGPLLQRVVSTVQRALSPIRVYVAQFGEHATGFHFHVFPRTAAVTREFLVEFPQQKDIIHGPVLLDWARERYRNTHATEETFQVLSAVRQEMQKPRADPALHPTAADPR